jgi:predicted nuclease of predicted toxin-antitoxin system
MWLLADENIPRPSIRLLRAAGHAIEAVAEFGPGLPDADVLAHAAENEQVLVTFDRDFGELIYRTAAPGPIGILHLRFVPTDPEEVGRVLHDLLTTSTIELAGRYTVVERERIRQRPLQRVL